MVAAPIVVSGAVLPADMAPDETSNSRAASNPTAMAPKSLRNLAAKLESVQVVLKERLRAEDSETYLDDEEQYELYNQVEVLRNAEADIDLAQVYSVVEPTT